MRFVDIAMAGQRLSDRSEQIGKQVVMNVEADTPLRFSISLQMYMYAVVVRGNVQTAVSAIRANIKFAGKSIETSALSTTGCFISILHVIFPGDRMPMLDDLRRSVFAKYADQDAGRPADVQLCTRPVCHCPISSK